MNSSRLLKTLGRLLTKPAKVFDSPQTPEEEEEEEEASSDEEKEEKKEVTETPVVRILEEEEEEEAGDAKDTEEHAPLPPPRFDIVRASRTPLLRSVKARTVRKPFVRPFSARVSSLHMPLRTITSAVDKKSDKLRRRQFAEEELGLPRNTIPLVLRTLYPQYALERRLLLEACQKPRDERLMRLFLDYGRLVSVEVWKEFTLADALTYEHDHGLFIALDAILVAYFYNLMTDLVSLLAAEGRRRVTHEDVHFVLRTLWPSRAAGRQSLARIFQ